MAQTPSGLSQHPADQLIRELIATGREATPEEIEQIVERMATAPFDARVVRVASRHRGLNYLGRTLGSREDSLTYHLVQRTMVDGQWIDRTTASQYLADLRRAVCAPDARLIVYERRGGNIAAVVAPTDEVLPAERRGWDPLAEVVVVYSADRGIIVTGYQFSELARTGIPETATWLK